MSATTLMHSAHSAVLGLPAGPLTVDLQGCSRKRGLVIVMAWLSRAALLPQDCVPDAQIIFGRLGRGELHWMAEMLHSHQGSRTKAVHCMALHRMCSTMSVHGRWNLDVAQYKKTFRCRVGQRGLRAAGIDRGVAAW
jgi:hypothetical protein